MWSDEDATKAALAIGTGGAVTKAPKDALRSGFSRLRGTPKFMRSIDLQKQGQEVAEKVIDEKESIQQAMFRSDVGEITFDYGSPKLGLNHIKIQRTKKDKMTTDEA